MIPINLDLIELQMRNIFSYGNNTTIIPLNIKDPTLIIGENHDAMVNGEFDANATGKSAILNSLLYAFFGRTGDGKHKVDGLINNINKKNLYVAVIFKSPDGVYYKIERWRKNKKMGGVNNSGVKISYGDSIDTIDNNKTPATRSIDAYIAEHVLGMDFDIFARIATIIGSYEPFLSLPPTHTTKTSQTSILEELFGQKILTEKAVILKQKIKHTTTDIKSLTELNDRILAETSRYEEQLKLAESSISEWDKTSADDIKTIKKDIVDLESIDFDAELKLIESFNEATSELNTVTSEYDTLNAKVEANAKNETASTEWDVTTARKLKSSKRLLSPYDNVNFEEEYTKLQSILDMTELCDTNRIAQVTLKSTISDTITLIKDVDAEIAILVESKCPYCEQTFHDNEPKIADKKTILADLGDEYATLHTTLQENVDMVATTEDAIREIDCMYTEVREYDASKSSYDNLVKTISDIENETNPYDAVLLDPEELLVMTDDMDVLNGRMIDYRARLDNTTPSEYTLDVVYDKQAKLKQLKLRLVEKVSAVNPHGEAVKRLAKVFDSIDELKIDEVDDLKVLLKHQDFMLKLLTRKDSFIRQALLDVNLPLLNTRLRYYLDAIGLFHNVTFTKTMTVSISQFDNVIDFSNLSTGQKARINLAIAFAFRDIVQERHHKINFCILDECLDHGLSTLGVKLAAKMIKKIASDNDLSMYVITHRDEIKSAFDKTLKTILKGGLTKIEFS